MDRRRRIEALAVALLLLLAALAVQAATANPPAEGTVTTATDPYPGDTLITVQSFDSFAFDNGEALIVTPEGRIRWRFDPPRTRVFDGEMLDDGTVMLAMATRIPAPACPGPYAHTDPNPASCVLNRVAEVDLETNRIGWNYAWYDAWVKDHEVHDADRLANGNTAIVDMGNDRAFVVNPAGEIVWEWHARDRIGPGTQFWSEYVPRGKQKAFTPPSHPEADWTHMNDIDAVGDGNFHLSIRNFDVVIEVDGRTGAIVDVVGRPGSGPLREQHDPNYLAGPGTMLVADSVNDRIVELDPATMRRGWTYTGTEGPLQWPRDADRLPNGNTLIVDSRNFRVLEVNATGAVVWAYSLQGRKGIVYDADRLGLPEEPDAVPAISGPNDPPGIGPVAGLAGTVGSWTAVLLPAWVGFPEAMTAVAALLIAVLLGVDLTRYRRGR